MLQLSSSLKWFEINWLAVLQVSLHIMKENWVAAWAGADSILDFISSLGKVQECDEGEDWAPRFSDALLKSLVLEVARR